MGFDPATQAFADFERAGWDEVAAGYADQSEGSTAQISEPLLDSARVGEGCRVLDLATGPGWTAAAAARQGADVIGVDLAAGTDMFARADDEICDELFSPRVSARTRGIQWRYW